MSTGNTEVVSIPMVDILLDSDFNCRGLISPVSVAELANDIKAKGLMAPVTVAPLKEKRINPKTGHVYVYKLIAGHRRFTAHIVNEAKTINCFIRVEMADELKARIFNLAENVQRSDLSFMQEARALQKLLDLGLSEQAMGKELSKTRGWIQKRILTLKLPKPAQEAIEAGFVKQTQINDLYTIFTKKCRNGNLEPLQDAIKVLKDAQIRGDKVPVINPHKKTMVSRHKRADVEVNNMQDLITDTIGQCFATEILGWVTGHNSTGEIFESIKKIADEKGLIISLPEEL